MGFLADESTDIVRFMRASRGSFVGARREIGLSVLQRMIQIWKATGAG